MSIVRNLSLISFKIMLPYILNFIENDKMWLISIFGASLKTKVMPLTSEREIATVNGMWLTYPSHLE